MESETAHILEKVFHQQILSRFINYFTFNVFVCFFAGDDVKTNDFCKVFWYYVNKKSF